MNKFHTMFLLQYRLRKKNLPSHFRHFWHIFPKILHSMWISQQIANNLAVSGKTRGKRTHEPRHVAFSSGYSIAIFIRHAFGKFVSSLCSGGSRGFFCCHSLKKSCCSQMFESFLQIGKTLLKNHHLVFHGTSCCFWFAFTKTCMTCIKKKHIG